jgi:cytoskeletal protein CcmA (bactofilin family)
VGLFGKPEEKKSSPTSPQPAASSSVSRAATSSSASVKTVVGRNSVFKGELVSTDDVLIEGRVEGKVRCEALLIIGESGQVHAEIESKSVSIRGKVEGNCSSTHRVEITETGKVLGNVRAPLIVVAEGAVFRGASEMSKGKEKEKEQGAAPKPEKSQTETVVSAPSRS